MAWSYEGGFCFCAKKAFALGLEYQFNVRMAQRWLAQGMYFQGII